MALCLIIDNPDQTAEQFEKVMEHLRAGGPVPAEGASLLIAGPADGVWRVISVWDSPESMQRFFAERMGPAFAAAGVSPAGSTRSTFEIHTLVSTDRAALQDSGGSR